MKAWTSDVAGHQLNVHHVELLKLLLRADAARSVASSDIGVRREIELV